MAKNNGKPSEREFLSIWASLPFTYAHRVTDAADLHGINGRPVGDFPKPSDFIILEPDGIHFAEVKSTVSQTSFSYDQLERGQKSTAAQCARCKTPLSYRIYVHAIALGKWFIITADEFVSDTKSGIKSRKWESLTPW